MLRAGGWELVGWLRDSCVTTACNRAKAAPNMGRWRGCATAQLALDHPSHPYITRMPTTAHRYLFFCSSAFAPPAYATYKYRTCCHFRRTVNFNMTAYHRTPFQVLPLSYDEKLRAAVFAHSIPLSQALSFLEVKGDLLPDLWHTKTTASPLSQPLRLGVSLWAQTPPASLLPALLAHLPQYTSASYTLEGSGSVLLPSGADFGLAPLTEENLTAQYGFGRRPHSYSDNSNEDLFLFEQQVQMNGHVHQNSQNMVGPNNNVQKGGQHSQPQITLPPYTENMHTHTANMQTHISNPHTHTHNLQYPQKPHRNTPRTFHSPDPQPRPYGFQDTAKPQHVNTQLYKTELCASFMKLAVCPYGNKCQFAHGENELKSVDRPPKWRSKPCANWAKFGSCRYGNRCCFKHGRD